MVKQLDWYEGHNDACTILVSCAYNQAEAIAWLEGNKLSGVYWDAYKKAFEFFAENGCVPSKQVATSNERLIAELREHGMKAFLDGTRVVIRVADGGKVRYLPVRSLDEAAGLVNLKAEG